MARELHAPAPELLPSLVQPILDGRADDTKGNRFHDLAEISRMPPRRPASPKARAESVGEGLNASRPRQPTGA